MRCFRNYEIIIVLAKVPYLILKTLHLSTESARRDISKKIYIYNIIIIRIIWELLFHPHDSIRRLYVYCSHCLSRLMILAGCLI